MIIDITILRSHYSTKIETLQVVTGADDSTIGIWDLETGAKSMLFTNAHGGEEITCMTFDPSWRRLFTGARNGTIKVIIKVTDPDLRHVSGRPTNHVPKIWVSCFQKTIPDVTYRK